MIDSFARRLVLPLFLINVSLCLIGQTTQSFLGVIKADHARSSALARDFRDVTIFQMNVQALDRFVRAQDYNGEITLTIGDRYAWKLLLFEHDIRSASWQARDPRAGNITFRGLLDGMADSRVRLSINGSLLAGFISDGKQYYYIEPLGHFLPAEDDWYVVYEPEDVTSDDQHSLCGVFSQHTREITKSSARSNATQPAACLVTELAIALDYSYVSHHGGYTAAVDKAITVMNMVDPNFDDAFESDIEFEIVELFAATTAQEDPPEWTNTLDGGALLSNFRYWGNIGGFESDFDLAQLWTRRNFHYDDKYGVVGLAYIGTTCNYSRFHLLEHYTSNMNSLRVLTGHEIGHNFGARHDTLSDFIMKSSVNPSATTFSQMSIDIVNNSLSNRSCLTDCSLSCPDGVTITVGDPMGNYDAGTIIRTIGEVTVNTNSLFDAPEVLLYPNFSTNSGVVFEIRSDGCE